VIVPVNPAFGVDEARYVFEHAAARLVAASAETMDTLRGRRPGVSNRPRS